MKTWSYYQTAPLKNLLNNQLSKLKKLNTKLTLIGSTNLNTGKLDVFKFELYNKDDQLNILLSSSAIPVVFKPIRFNNTLYVDGGTISNEILNGFEEYLVDKKYDYYNITFISSSSDITKVNSIDNIESYIKRLINVFMDSFNNELIELSETKCSTTKIGDIYYYFPKGDLTQYSRLDFTHCFI